MKRLIAVVSIFFIIMGFISNPANADARLTAIPSSNEVTQDENLSIEFRAASEGTSGDFGEPRYEAPDFDEVNNFSRETGMSSAFINGHLTVNRTQSWIYVLHPRKAGTLVIRNIQIQINGQTVKAPDLSIEVHPSGAKIANRGSGGLGYPQPGRLPPGGVHSPSQQRGGLFLIRAEPSKLKVYKGEQVILTYALYTRVGMMNIQVERYPNPTGFLKEDIDIPLLRGRLDYAPAVVNGHEYRRAVMAQYAIFPVKEGTLPIDTFTAKFTFQAGPRMGGDDDDPFAMLNQFFKAMQTTTETATSDRVSIEVLPLPGAGQPANFQGLVGDFDITAMLDKTTVKAGEPVNLKVKVEGRGHAGSLERLNINWPQDFELYEDKSNTQFLKTGYSERVFDYMVIPKTKGRFEIPPIELSMFNPDSKAYQTKKTSPLSIEVLEGTPGSVYVPKSIGKSEPPRANEDIRYWKDQISENQSTALRAVARGVAMAAMVLVVFSLWSLISSQGDNTRRAKQQAGDAIKEKARALRTSTAPPVEVLGEVETLLAQILEIRYGIAIGSLTHAEIAQTLLSRAQTDEATAKRVSALLAHVESQRYAPGGGDSQAATRAVEELNAVIEQV